MSRYYQGKFKPKNRDKYIGDVDNIIYRSGWERRFFQFCDSSSKVLGWASEELVIPYISPMDNRAHRYFTDAYVELKQKDGSVQKKVIEIKPYAQTQFPKRKKNIPTYLVNKAKWEAADKFCKKNNMEFQIITERELGI